MVNITHFLNRTRIITHPKPGPHIPCKTVSEVMFARWFTPRWVAVWRARRTIRFIYPLKHERMTLINATRTKGPLDYHHKWTVTFDTGCGNKGSGSAG